MIRLLVIDDHPVVRQGIRQILAEAPDIVVGADAVNGAEALEKGRQGNWGAVLLDLSLGETDGLEILKQLRQEQPTLPILVLSMHPEEQFGVRAIRAGPLAHGSPHA
jgi:DNA-binding NarL/FixJ family response regulator